MERISRSDNTWESVDQVHAPELIKEYHQQKPLEHIRRSLIKPQTTSCLKRPFLSSSTLTTLQHQSCLTLSSPPPTCWSNLTHLFNHLTRSEEKTCQPYPYPSSWPWKNIIHPSPPNAPTLSHLSCNTQTSLPIVLHNTPVDLPMRDHVLSPSITSWTMMQSRMPSQSWTSRFKPKHPHRLDHIPTTMSTQEPHTMASPWRNWNPTSLGYTVSCNDLSKPLKWKKNNTRWPKITSKEWWQKGIDTPRGINKTKALHPLWTRSSILERRSSVTGLGY